MLAPNLRRSSVSTHNVDVSSALRLRAQEEGTVFGISAMASPNCQSACLNLTSELLGVYTEVFMCICAAAPAPIPAKPAAMEPKKPAAAAAKPAAMAPGPAMEPKKPAAAAAKPAAMAPGPGAMMTGRHLLQARKSPTCRAPGVSALDTHIHPWS